MAAAPSVPQEPSRTDARVDAEAERVGTGDERPAERADLAEGAAEGEARAREKMKKLPSRCDALKGQRSPGAIFMW